MREEFDYLPASPTNLFPDMEEITMKRQGDGVFDGLLNDQQHFRLIVWQSGYEIITTETFKVQYNTWVSDLTREIHSPTRKIFLHYKSLKGGIRYIEFEGELYVPLPHKRGVQLQSESNNETLAVAIASWRDSDIKQGLIGHIYSNPTVPRELIAYLFIHVLLIENVSGYVAMPLKKPN